jgi:hypothetical protein
MILHTVMVSVVYAESSEQAHSAECRCAESCGAVFCYAESIISFNFLAPEQKTKITIT